MSLLATSSGHTHVEPVMGTIVAITSPSDLPEAAVDTAVAVLHAANRVFSTWNQASPMSRVRSGQIALDALEPDDAAAVYEVLGRCALARELTGGAFDPWAMPGGLDPTGLVKGWAAGRALRVLTDAGVDTVMVNAGGDIAVAGVPPTGPWRIGIRHPSRADSLAAVIEVSGAIATSGEYERPGHLVDPKTGSTVSEVSSATVTGPELDLADALATGLSVAGPSLLPVIDELPGYEAFLIVASGKRYATPGMHFVDAA